MARPVLQHAVEFALEAIAPKNFVYRYLMRTSGPQSALGVDYELNTDSAIDISIFEYQVPIKKIFELVRFNMYMLDKGIYIEGFAGLPALSNGCLFEIIDNNGTVQLDFLDNVPLKRDIEFTPLVGIDNVLIVDRPDRDDGLGVRFTVAKAGAKMSMPSGWKARWTNRDKLDEITSFRIMVQGTLEDTSG